MRSEVSVFLSKLFKLYFISGHVLLRSKLATPGLRNHRFMNFSFCFIWVQTASTFRIKLTSALMKRYSPPALSVLRSVRIRSAASWDRPMK